MTTEGHCYIQVAVEHFSQFSTLVPLKDKTAKSVATTLIDGIFSKFKNSSKILISNNGAEFNNQILNEVCTQFYI